MCEICSKLTINKIPEQRQWHCSGVFIVNFEQFSHIHLGFLIVDTPDWEWFYVQFYVFFVFQRRLFNPFNIFDETDCDRT